MRHHRSFEELQIDKSWLTIGSFDGVHHGHQEILKYLTSDENKWQRPVVVLSFFPHPAIVLGRRQEPFYINTPDERAALLFGCGADHVITQTFDLDLAKMPAITFVESLQRHLGFEKLVVGPDFALGHKREGDIQYLRTLGKNLGYSVDMISPYQIGDVVVSSSNIRKFLKDGFINRAALFLGRPFFLKGTVVRGDARGRLIGFPTANLDTWDERAVPKPGVYACMVNLGDTNFKAVTNIGYRPTFNNKPENPLVETHLLNFNGDIYGDEIQIDFIQRLRDEIRFPGIDYLMSQIEKDILQARQIFDQ
jgi:riboflavin kinase/FMN adenylyltransferase